MITNRSLNKNKQLSANLIRIIPSNLTFKHIRSGADTSIDPLESIADLVRTDLGSFDRFKMAALSRKNEKPTVAMREIMMDLFNKKAKIISFINNTPAKNIAVQNQKLEKLMLEGTFDVELRKKYDDVSNNTDLALKIYHDNREDSQNAIIRFRENVKSISDNHEVLFQTQN